MHPACANKEQNHLQNSLLRRDEESTEAEASQEPVEEQEGDHVAVAIKAVKTSWWDHVIQGLMPHRF